MHVHSHFLSFFLFFLLSVPAVWARRVQWWVGLIFGRLPVKNLLHLYDRHISIGNSWCACWTKSGGHLSSLKVHPGSKVYRMQFQLSTLVFLLSGSYAPATCMVLIPWSTMLPLEIQIKCWIPKEQRNKCWKSNLCPVKFGPQVYILYRP